MAFALVCVKAFVMVYVSGCVLPWRLGFRRLIQVSASPFALPFASVFAKV
jgi:hypothetical protein